MDRDKDIKKVNRILVVNEYSVIERKKLVDYKSFDLCLELFLVLSMETDNCKRKIFHEKIRVSTGTWTSPMC